ncbi:MAG: hypothetical protein AAGA10_00365 [Bacteroidota bacterium]
MKVHFLPKDHGFFPKYFGNSLTEYEYVLGGIGVEKEGKLGASAVLYENPYHSLNERDSLSFGYLKLEDDISANFLFEKMKWLSRSRGISQIIGPINGSTWFPYRLMCANKNTPFLTEIPTPACYPNILEENYFEVLKSYHSNQVHSLAFEEAYLTGIQKQIRKWKWSEEGLSQVNLEEELYAIAVFCNTAFKENFLFSPINPNRFIQLYTPLLSQVDTQFIRLVKNREGGIEALLLAFPDISNSYKRLIIKTVCRNPKGAIKGLGKYLVQWATQKAHAQGYSSLIHAFMASDNMASAQASKEMFGGTCYRRYQLFIHRL